jgi:conjugal transfer pilus assembly protein TrbC
MWALLAGLAFTARVACAQAETPLQRPVVTEADIARAQQSQPTVTDRDIENARRRHAPVESAQQAPRATPRIDALPQPKAQAIDLGAVAQGFASDASSGLGAPRDPALLVFISLTMPAPTLARLVDQASRARAPLILRGLSNGSLTETVSKVQRLIGGRAVGVQIDPQAYDRYGIGSVPAFVLTSGKPPQRECAAGTCGRNDDFVKAAGDVSLDHALRQLGRASTTSARAVRPYLQRLER